MIQARGSTAHPKWYPPQSPLHRNQGVFGSFVPVNIVSCEQGCFSFHLCCTLYLSVCARQHAACLQHQTSKHWPTQTKAPNVSHHRTYLRAPCSGSFFWVCKQRVYLKKRIQRDRGFLIFFFFWHFFSVFLSRKLAMLALLL